MTSLTATSSIRPNWIRSWKIVVAAVAVVATTTRVGTVAAQADPVVVDTAAAAAAAGTASAAAASTTPPPPPTPVVYGMDCSYPIQSKDWKCGADGLFGPVQQQAYEELMQGCRNHYSQHAHRCDHYENDRLAMNLRQPVSVLNYTATGYKKIKAPAALMERLTKFFNDNRDVMYEEDWPEGYMYVNNWKAPSYTLKVENSSLKGGGFEFRQELWDIARSVLEEWTGQELRPVSLYGIRIYTGGSILTPHVDRLPLVASAIINVAQDVEEDWVLEVYDRHDNAVNVTMEPGDMVLYESHSLIHGRPFALKGKYFANIFMHYEPVGRPLDSETPIPLNEMDGGKGFYPPYLIPGSRQAAVWLEETTYGWKSPYFEMSDDVESQEQDERAAHEAAFAGQLDRITELHTSETHRHLLHAVDSNGWTPLFEAVRADHIDIVHYLIDTVGVDPHGMQLPDGSTLLDLAEYYESLNSAAYLIELGVSRSAVSEEESENTEGIDGEVEIENEGEEEEIENEGEEEESEEHDEM